VLGNVCPNCGGGFSARPIRPAHDSNDGNFLGKDPAGTRVRHHPVDAEKHAAFTVALRSLAPEKR